MKILFLYSSGIGNCVQMIPLFNALEKHFGRVLDVGYVMQFEGESPKNAGITPNPVIEPLTIEMVDSQGYDWTVAPPFITGPDGLPPREFLDNMRERDSEFERNMKILDYLGIEREIIRDCRTKPVAVPENYCVMHNGSNPHPTWRAKKYPKMEELAWMIQRSGIRCLSVGSPEEHIFGTEDYSGLTLTETAHVIQNCTMYCGTDTGTYHIAALMNKPGLVIYTLTSQMKNYDPVFHKSITTVQRDDLDCCPCQLGFHWSLERRTCQNHICQDIPPEFIFKSFMEKING